MLHDRFGTVTATLVIAMAAGCGDGGQPDNRPVTAEVIDTTPAEDIDLFAFNSVHPDLAADDLGEYAAVDIAVDAVCITASLSYGALYGPIQTSWGRHLLRALQSDGEHPCQGEVVAGGDSLDVGRGVRSTAVVYATEEQELGVTVFQTPRDGVTRLAIRHTAAMGCLEFRVDPGPAEPVSLEVGGQLLLEVEPGEHDVALVSEDDEAVSMTRRVAVEEGKTTAVFATGSSDTGSLELLAHGLEDG
ncbi:MAG: hypothetical protein JW751_29480 [Polyangiaceae bacterium]|nr:hypothetical protein [Polyangiaceae bacterium]